MLNTAGVALLLGVALKPQGTGVKTHQIKHSALLILISHTYHNKNKKNKHPLSILISSIVCSLKIKHLRKIQIHFSNLISCSVFALSEVCIKGA